MSKPESAFDVLGFQATVDRVVSDVKELYVSDGAPWVVGYSGGKDSTAVLALVWLALRQLQPEMRTKTVHVITTDTLVENPVVAAWVGNSLKRIHDSAASEGLPIEPHRLTPDVRDTFWVNLIGRGYPAPRNKFRWCTERLKIKPSNSFITRVVRQNGEAILVLGTRRAESARRAANMAVHAQGAIRDRLAPNAALPNSLVFTPIEHWTNDDVWRFLMQIKNPWGHSNKELLGMYRGASADGECPLVVDTSTPSCGNSRFGCWVCTLVDQDKSMAAMIQNDHEKDWMLPLLELRNELDFRAPESRALERERRDFRRMSGGLTGYMAAGDVQLVPGPYTQEAREHWLKRVLETQSFLRERAPDGLNGYALITPEELSEIRRIWVVEKHEIEDRLPVVYEQVTGERYPDSEFDEHHLFDRDALQLLRESADGDELHYELIRNLLDVERRFRTMSRRRGLYSALEDQIRRCYFEDASDALEFVRANALRRTHAAGAVERILDGLRSVEAGPKAQASHEAHSGRMPLFVDDDYGSQA
jgi:DNA sulfur modification protein DndC